MQPDHTAQVLVIGAGPAGCAAALTLARAGIATILADQSQFPRDKVCGDALIPDALRALAKLRLSDEILPAARHLRRLRLYAPDGRHVDVEGELACLPRNRLDDGLRRAAVAAGARFLAPLRLTRFLETDGALHGAGFRTSGGGAEVSIRAALVLLATGGASAPLELAGVCLRKAPSGFALRGYFRNERKAREIDSLCLSFDRAVLPGYGWIFPGPEGVFNVGAGCFLDGARQPTANLREVFDAFVRHFPPARSLLSDAQALGPLKGAPLRTALKGARLHRPGLLVAGEAAGSTYSFSGEGIGKALETGVLAAEHALGFFRGDFDAATLGPAYERALAATLAARFTGYEKAQRWLTYPAVCDFIAARARRGGFVKEQLQGMLDESCDPGALFSWRALLRAALSYE